MFSRHAGFGLVFFGIGNGHPQSVLLTVDTAHKSCSQIFVSVGKAKKKCP